MEKGRQKQQHKRANIYATVFQSVDLYLIQCSILCEINAEEDFNISQAPETRKISHLFWPGFCAPMFSVRGIFLEIIGGDDESLEFK
jgi:hypothetical protein